MRKSVVILSLFFSIWAQGQDLLNFYLEPNGSENSVTLHTTVYYYNVAYYLDHSIQINGNVIEFNLCYAKTELTAETYDQKEFVVNLPSGFPNFIFNINFYTWDETGTCDYSNVLDSGTINFNFPYNPTEKTYIPDDNFEGYLEAKEVGDDISNNDYVYTHRFENITHLFIDFIDLNLLGLQEIEDLTGIEVLLRLEVLKCSGNLISEFNASNHNQLKRLYCDSNPLSTLDLTNIPNLKMLTFGNDNISEIDLTQNVNLEYLTIRTSEISGINLSQNTKLLVLSFQYTQISTIDLSNNTLLNYLVCDNNILTSLNLENNHNLTTLFCNLNELESLILASFNLEYLNCTDNLLNVLDLSSCPNLKELGAANNNIESLDFSFNSQIELLVLYNNNLETLNLRNGNNEILETVVAFVNPNLYCISVDDPASAPYGGQWFFDNNVNYSEDCLLGVNDVNNVLESTLYPNPVHSTLYLETSIPIISLQIFNVKGEQIFSIMGDVSQLDFSNYLRGIYFIKMKSAYGFQTKKVIKE